MSMTTSGYAALAVGESWHYVGDGTTGLGTTFATGWSNAASPEPALAFRLREAGIVDVVGVLVSSGGAGSSIFTLPSDYRPNNRVPLVVMGSTSTTNYAEVLQINTDGTVQIPTVRESVYISGSFFLNTAAP